jgi:DNA-binding TFAR19-related protein (PDSD5 family)
MRSYLLGAFWTVNRVAIVKPDVARMVGDRLIQLAQMGQIKSKVDEDVIIQLLEQVQQQAQKTTIKVRHFPNSFFSKYSIF